MMDGITAFVAPLAVIGVAILIRVKAAGWPGVPFTKAKLFGKRTARLSVVSRAQLTPQHSLHLVKWDNRELLVVASPAGCQMWPADGSQTAASSMAFNESATESGAPVPRAIPFAQELSHSSAGSAR